MSAPFRLLLVVGARPNFMKVAPIVRELQRDPATFAWRLVHTGQHYDTAMSTVFFDQLGIPRPDVDLGIGSGTHAQQTAAIMAAVEPVMLHWRPDLIVVLGDVNSTLACALVACKLGIRVAHVEAGLRSFDRSMPEEINRLLTDQISDLLFVTEQSGVDNLLHEGRPAHAIHFVGNVMIDTLLAHRDEARHLDIPQRHGLTPGEYAVLTLHRPSNVDDEKAFDRLFTAIETLATDLPVVFPVHPRARAAIAQSARASGLVERGRLQLLEPLGYLEFIGLLADAAVVLTDSGGVQEETTVLCVPCLTLRESTERPVTISHGTNILAGTDPRRILDAWRTVRTSGGRAVMPPLWDGGAARRIVDVLREQVAGEAAGTAVEATS